MYVVPEIVQEREELGAEELDRMPVVQSSAGHVAEALDPGGTTGLEHVLDDARRQEAVAGHQLQSVRVEDGYEVVLSTAVQDAHDVCAAHKLAAGTGAAGHDADVETVKPPVQYVYGDDKHVFELGHQEQLADVQAPQEPNALHTLSDVQLYALALLGQTEMSV